MRLKRSNGQWPLADELAGCEDPQDV